MNHWLDRIPIFVFRLAVVLVAVIAIGAVLVLLGMSWHDASLWVVRLGGFAVVVVAAVWVIGTLKEH